MPTKRTTATTTPAAVPTRTGGSTSWQRHISAELVRLGTELTRIGTEISSGFAADSVRMDGLEAGIAQERALREKREQEESAKRAARRATDPVIEQIYAQQQAEAVEREEAEKRAAEREEAAHERARKIIAALVWLGTEVFTVISQKLAPASDMHTVTIGGSLVSVLAAAAIYLRQRK